MTTLTQEGADLPGCEDGEKARDAHPGGEHSQLACVELGYIIEQHMRFAGQGLKVARVRRAGVRGGVWGQAWSSCLFLGLKVAQAMLMLILRAAMSRHAVSEKHSGAQCRAQDLWSSAPTVWLLKPALAR